MGNNEIKRKLKKIIPATFAKVENSIEPALDELTGINREILWANAFHDTIIDSEWLKSKTFSPGRWGVGYQYLYVLYRVLNEIKPRNILELGMGQTTRMIGQYAAYYGGG